MNVQDALNGLMILMEMCGDIDQSANQLLALTSTEDERWILKFKSATQRIINEIDYVDKKVRSQTIAKPTRAKLSKEKQAEMVSRGYQIVDEISAGLSELAEMWTVISPVIHHSTRYSIEKVRDQIPIIKDKIRGEQ